MQCLGSSTNTVPLPSTSPCIRIQTSSLPPNPLSISRRGRRRGQLLSHSVTPPHHQSCPYSSLLDCGVIWSSFPGRIIPRASSPQVNVRQNPSLPPVVMLASFDYDPRQWDQPVEYLSDEWRRLASSPYVDASPGPGSVRASVESCTYVDTAGATIIVPTNRLGECLALLSVFQYFDRYPFCFDAS